MEKFIIPVFAVFGFLGSLFTPSGIVAGDQPITTTAKADLDGEA